MNERTTPNDPHLLGDLRAYQFVEFYEEGPGDILTLRDAAYCSIESYRKGDYRECYVDAVVHYDDLAASCLTIHQRGVELHFTDYSIELTGIECPRFLPLLRSRLIRTLDIPPNDYLDGKQGLWSCCQ